MTMETIKIKFYGNVMYITYVENYKGNMNTCKITENNEFFFSKDYLEKHLDTLHFYVTPIILKNQVTKVMISHKNLLPSIEKLVNLYSIINELCIEEDKELTVSDAKNIMNMLHIKEVECYDLGENLYYELCKKYNKKVALRSELLFESDFMYYNNITTSNKFYEVKEVQINEKMDSCDKEELEYLIEHNQNLEKILLKQYSEETIKYLAPILNSKNISLSVLNDSGITDKQFKYLKSIKKQSKTQLELSYSKQYQHKNAMKQLNLNLLRFCMVLVVFVCVGFASAERFIFEKDKKETESIDLTKYEEIIEELPAEEIIEEQPIEQTEAVEEVVEEVVPTDTYISPYYQTYSQVFSELKQVNPDTIGWIKVNNTNVNYPVVLASDNSYYLNHSFDKSTNSFGWIYADYRSNFDNLNQNTIIYGHHVYGTNLLFSTLTKTVDPNWYNNDSNLTITFNTEKGNMKWQIFSIYVIPVTNDYLITNFNSQESFLTFVQKLKDRSVKDFGVEVSGNDKIITLSTCYKDSTQRVVVHAKRIS